MSQVPYYIHTLKFSSFRCCPEQKAMPMFQRKLPATETGRGGFGHSFISFCRLEAGPREQSMEVGNVGTMSWILRRGKPI